MQKKTKLICLSCLIILVAGLCYLTVAYFTTESTTTNAISTGYVEMELYEKIVDDNMEWDLSSEEEQEEVPSISIMPGDTVSQEAYIKNTGSEDYYGRVSIEIQVEYADGEIETFALDENGASNGVVDLNIDSSKWVLDEDGWYRYVEVVPVAETCADPVFTEVTFSTAMDNSYIGSTITIIVGSQSVQAEYNGYDTTIEETVLDVDGFPEIIESEVTE